MPTSPKPVSRAHVLEQARELARDYGESLTLTAFRRETGLSQWAIFDLFGNWKNLRSAVGLTPEAPRTRNRVSKTRILEQARELAERHGERLTERLFLKETGFTGRLIVDRFGSWGALRTAAGLQPRARISRRYSEVDLLQDLYQAWRHRGTPRYHKHRFNGGKICPSTIREHYGRWAVVQIAYEVYRRQQEGIATPLLQGIPWSPDRYHQPSTTPNS